MDPASLILTSMEYLKPNLVFSGIEIVDAGPGTAGIKEDGRIQAGESVKGKVVVQNIGQNIAYDARYQVSSKDNNIYLSDAAGELGNLSIGEVKEFWLSLSPNKRVTAKGQLPVLLTLTNKEGYGNLINFQLPVELEQKPPGMQILEVKADIQSLMSQVTRFEFSSNKIKANVANLINISRFPRLKPIDQMPLRWLSGSRNTRILHQHLMQPLMPAL